MSEEKLYKIHESAQKIIDRYFNLKINGLENLKCPYYINSGHIKDLRAMVGKGSPEEIEMEIKIWTQLKGVDLEKVNVDEMRYFMRQRKIGIDCSGFVYHIYDNWLKESGGGSLASNIDFGNKSFLSKLKLRLRSAENIGADLITNENNTKKISINEVLPGDLVRSKGSKNNIDHVLIVTEVAKVDGKTTWLKYTHSTNYYGKSNGVREAKIEISNPEKELKDQNWLEKDKDGTIHTLQNLLYRYEDNGLRRPNFFDKLTHIEPTGNI